MTPDDETPAPAKTDRAVASSDPNTADRDRRRFNPLVNEADMFKLLVGVALFAGAAIALVLLTRALL